MRRSYNMRERIFIFVLFICAGMSDSSISSPEIIPIEDTERGTNFAASESGPNPGKNSNADTGHYFRVVSEMHNQSLVSGSRVLFRCKVEGYPMDDLSFTWYKANKVITTEEEPRIVIKQKSGMSRLEITGVFTADSGLYRCEASNGFRRVATQAFLNVRFERPPPPGKDEVLEPIVPAGKCEKYDGIACSRYLGGKYVYIDPYQTQLEVEQSISLALTRITDPKIVSASCQRFAFPALCYFVFPVCEDEDGGMVSIRGRKKPEDRATRLCRKDCELLMNDVCKDEFTNPDDDVFMEEIAATANCSQLPRITVRGSSCKEVEGLPSVVNKDHTCYNKTGTAYKGTERNSRSGMTCKTWPLDLVQQHTELSGGHSFCRNPGNLEEQPWCFIDIARKTREVCGVRKCVAPSTGSELIAILIPSLAIPLLIACIGTVFFFCCRGNQRRRSSKGIPGKQVQSGSSMQTVEMTLAPTKNISKIPHLSPETLHYTMDLGDGQYGKVYKAQLTKNMNFNSNYPVAVKTLTEGALGCHVEYFQREIDVFAELQHPNVACLKAVVVQPNRRCMVFEYTNRIDLHEYLSLHSPHSDVGMGTKLSSSASSQTSGSLEANDFINMMTQIASGMDYLSSRNFIHRDLAARNILVCQNNVLKICNLGVVRDCYLSCYYRSPQGGDMLPIRWMAPESIANNTFSVKTAVWSFGVLIWEIYSYGLQPYCGYSNQEVIDMITRFQFLPCPDQCPARVYALMYECWAQDPSTRPSFKDIYAKLCGWDGANATRMTSQLARGIHRQLTNIMSEGQYGQYSSADSASIPSYNTPSPPPTYNAVAGNNQGFPNIQQQFVTPAPLNVSPASHNVFSQSSSAASSSVPMYAGQRLAVNLQGQHDQNQPGFAQTSFIGNEANLPQRYYAEQQQALQRRPTHSNRSTSSCASSCSEYGPVVRPNPASFPGNVYNHPQQHPGFQYVNTQKQQCYGGIDYPNTSQHYQPHNMSNQQLRRPLSGVTEDESGVDSIRAPRSPPSIAIAPCSMSSDSESARFSQRRPELNTPVTVLNSASESKANDVKPEVASTQRKNEETDSSSSSSSAKAPSCDSGLPVDEDSELQNQANQASSIKSPLIAPKSHVSKNQSARASPTKRPSDRNLIA